MTYGQQPYQPNQPNYGPPPGYGQQPPFSQQPGYGQRPNFPPAGGQGFGQQQWQQAQRPPQQAPALTRLDHGIPVTTTDSLADRTTSKVIGDVVGVVTRPKSATDPRVLTQSRLQAVAELVGMAREAGADAVVGLRFATGDLGPSLELVAYGTAVRLAPARAAETVDDEPEPASSSEVAHPSSASEPAHTDATPPAWPFQPQNESTQGWNQ